MGIFTHFNAGEQRTVVTHNGQRTVLNAAYGIVYGPVAGWVAFWATFVVPAGKRESLTLIAELVS